MIMYVNSWTEKGKKCASIFYNPCYLKVFSSLVWIGVIHHKPCPLRHLAQVSVSVVEILDRCQISLRGQADGKCQ